MKLFIGCSSTNNIPDKYLKDCSNYLDELLRENDIVFGGCSTGLMGLAYNITKEYGNKVTGISPNIFKSDLDILGSIYNQRYRNISLDKDIVNEYKLLVAKIDKVLNKCKRKI